MDALEIEKKIQLDSPILLVWPFLQEGENY